MQTKSAHIFNAFHISEKIALIFFQYEHTTIIYFLLHIAIELRIRMQFGMTTPNSTQFSLIILM